MQNVRTDLGVSFDIQSLKTLNIAFYYVTLHYITLHTCFAYDTVICLVMTTINDVLLCYRDGSFAIIILVHTNQ